MSVTVTRAVKFSEAAERLSVSEATLRRMVKAGLIVQRKISARRLVIPETEIARLLGAHQPQG